MCQPFFPTSMLSAKFNWLHSIYSTLFLPHNPSSTQPPSLCLSCTTTIFYQFFPETKVIFDAHIHIHSKEMSGKNRLPSIHELVNPENSSNHSVHDHQKSSYSSSSFRGHEQPSYQRHTQPDSQKRNTAAGSQAYRADHSEDIQALKNDYQPPVQRLPSINEVLASTSISTSRKSHVQSSDDSRLEHQVKRPPSSSGFPCERCGRLFSRKADALKHIRVVHDRVKNFACSVCGRRFGRKDYCMVSPDVFLFS